MTENEIVHSLAGRWLHLAGKRLAIEVASGNLCDRCARSSLRTIGLAGGIGPVTVAGMLLDGYGSTLSEIAALAAAEYFSDDEDEALAS